MEEIIINTNFLDFLKTSELLNLELLNKKFNEIIENHQVWKIKCISDYPLIPNTNHYDIRTSRILAITYNVKRLYRYFSKS